MRKFEPVFELDSIDLEQKNSSIIDMYPGNIDDYVTMPIRLAI